MVLGLSILRRIQDIQWLNIVSTKHLAIFYLKAPTIIFYEDEIENVDELMQNTDPCLI